MFRTIIEWTPRFIKVLSALTLVGVVELLAECVIRYNTLAVANVYQTVSSENRQTPIKTG